MAERLVILSDMWGSKKGLWITSYLGYLQSYFDIVFYDCRELAYLDVKFNTRENIYDAFVNGGLNTAVGQLLKKEIEPSHYLTFCAGGTIAWEAALKGLPIKSLYAISPLNLHIAKQKPDIAVNLLYGEFQQHIPESEWGSVKGITLEKMPKFGHDLYSDEKIIKKVCLDLLESKFNIRYKEVG